ncbi:hypothetical protein JOM56_001076 [Amanita muscaria]
MLLAYKFERDGRIRFSAVARKITVLVAPGSTTAASLDGTEKRKAPEEVSEASGSKKAKLSNSPASAPAEKSVTLAL